MRFLDDYRGFTRARAALPYIAYTIALLACGALVAFPNYFYDWAVVGAKFIGVGASTALFTRFLGGMGLFKDAISDVLGDDKWLDRRNDLEDLLRRISRRLFLPGFQETSETTEFLSDFNNAIARMVMRSAVHRHGYYEIDVNRVVRVKWKDEAERTLEMTDTVNCDVVVFSDRDQEYRVIATPASGNTLAAYGIDLDSASVDGRQLVPLEIASKDTPGTFVIPLKPKSKQSITRVLRCSQNLTIDPLIYVSCGHVAWGMTVTIVNGAKGLRIAVEEVGVQNVFKPEQNDEDFMRYVAKGVLLPEQGLSLVLTTSA